MSQLMPQIIGIVAVGAFVFILSLITWYVIKGTMGLRVSREEEIEGLDSGEHGNSAYPDFQIVEPTEIG
jgi:Amt family ammonium transporter